jgi:hypothetical protein
MGYFWGHRKGRAKQRRELKAQTEAALRGTTGAIGSTGPTGPIGITPGLYSVGGYASSSVTTVTIPSLASYASLPVPPPVLKDMGLAIEPIVGLRSFYVDPETMQLVSFNGFAWPHREPLEALCNENLFADHDAPHEDCVCGIYAWKHNDEIDRTAGNVFGDVYMWGDVLICDEGYRAQLAYPKSLTLKAVKATRVLERLRDGLAVAYGVPVELRLGT